MSTQIDQRKIVDIDEYRTRAFGPWFPDDREEHVKRLETMIRFAETALSILELSEVGKHQWALQDLDHPEMREAVDALGSLPPDGYRLALEVVESEVQDLIASSPRDPSRR